MGTAHFRLDWYCSHLASVCRPLITRYDMVFDNVIQVVWLEAYWAAVGPIASSSSYERRMVVLPRQRCFLRS